MDSETNKFFSQLQTPNNPSQEIQTKLKEDSIQINSEQTETPPPEEARYQILKTLGEGGMGLVQLAHDSLLKREIALKTIKIRNLPQKKLNDKQQMMLWRLKQEAETTAILEHPNIVPLYDLKKKDNGEVYFTMRRVQGETFSNILKKKKQEDPPLDREDLLTIFKKICDAVAYAHSVGVIHRDLKPENVMVGQFGEVYVMDWGIAKHLKQENSNSTHEDLFREINSKTIFKTIGGIGTPGYMPPEQRDNATQVTPQSDIYALGKILRECFSLQSPFQEFQELLNYYTKHGKNEGDLKKKEQETAIPEDIQAIVEKATHQDWQKRYSSVKELMTDVEQYQKNRRVSARNYNFSQLFLKWVKRNQKKLILGCVFLAIFLGFWGYLKYQEKQYFESNLEQAKKENALGKEEQQAEKKMEHFLKGLYAIDTALLMSPKHQKVEQLKLKLIQPLIKSACDTGAYSFAYYFVKEVMRLETIEEQQKIILKEEVDWARTRILREHQQQLNYWKLALKDPLPGMRDEAILEISKMKDPEILEAVAQEVKEGTQYFLTSKERTSKRNEYYEIMVVALGAFGNPEIGPILWESLNSMSQQVLRFKEGSRPNADVQYMVSLTQALINSKASGFSEKLRDLRWKMGQQSLFSKRTELSFRKLLLLDQFVDKRQANSFQDFFDRAYLKSEIKDIDGAILDYTEAIRLHPQFYEAYNNRGNAKRAKIDIEGAILDYNEAIRLHPQFAEAYTNRGIAKQEKEDINGAILDYTEAIRLNPQFHEAYNNRGNAKSDNGNIEGAILDYTEAIRLNPQFYEAYNNRGIAKSDNRDFDGAILDYTEAIRLNPQYANAYNNRGIAKNDHGDFDGAILDYTETIRLNPQYAGVYTNRGNAKKDKRDFEGAILDYTEAIRLNPQLSEAYTSRGVAKRDNGDIEGAILDHTEAIRLNPQYALAYSNRGIAKQEKGDTEGAILDYTEAIRLNPQYAEAYISRAFAKQEKEDIEGAILDYTEAIRLNPQYAEAYNNRGNIKRAKGDIEGAILDYTEAIRLNPQYALAYSNRGITKQAKEDFDSAILDYTEAIRLNPQLAEVYNNRGAVKRAKGDVEGAILDCTESIRLNPQLAEAYSNRGIAKYSKGDRKGAIEDLASGLNLKNHPEATKIIVDLLKQQVREEFFKKDWIEAKSTILKLKQYLPQEGPEQKQLDQKIQQLDQLIQEQEKK